MCPLLTDLAVMAGPAGGAVTQETVDLILTVAVHARVRLTFVNVYNKTQLACNMTHLAAILMPQRDLTVHVYFLFLIQPPLLRALQV